MVIGEISVIWFALFFSLSPPLLVLFNPPRLSRSHGNALAILALLLAPFEVPFSSRRFRYLSARNLFSLSLSHPGDRTTRFLPPRQRSPFHFLRLLPSPRSFFLQHVALHRPHACEHALPFSLFTTTSFSTLSRDDVSVSHPRQRRRAIARPYHAHITRLTRSALSSRIHDKAFRLQ